MEEKVALAGINPQDDSQYVYEEMRELTGGQHDKFINQKNSMKILKPHHRERNKRLLKVNWCSI